MLKAQTKITEDAIILVNSEYEKLTGNLTNCEQRLTELRSKFADKVNNFFEKYHYNEDYRERLEATREMKLKEIDKIECEIQLNESIFNELAQEKAKLTETIDKLKRSGEHAKLQTRINKLHMSIEHSTSDVKRLEK
uniref:Uncharacterized protein n=2 Tax=Tetranychus urticae TaxID=32264 RepID=T1K0P7_TETUR